MGAPAWVFRGERLDGGRTVRCRCRHGGTELSVADAIDGWRHEPGFRAAFGAWLAAAPFEAFFWEMPPIRAGATGAPFECIVTDSPGLAGARADARPFAAPLARAAATSAIATFPNLGGDALLVVPHAESPQPDYPHLAAFARTAPDALQHALWQAVGDAAAQRLDPRPLWISTSGLGVFWLHVRLDEHPKYYTFAPYRDAAPG